MLRNAGGGGGWVSGFLEKNVMEVYGSTLLALRGGGWWPNSLEKGHYITLEWPLIRLCHSLKLKSRYVT